MEALNYGSETESFEQRFKLTSLPEQVFARVTASDLLVWETQVLLKLVKSRVEFWWKSLSLFQMSDRAIPPTRISISTPYACASSSLISYLRNSEYLQIYLSPSQLPYEGSSLYWHPFPAPFIMFPFIPVDGLSHWLQLFCLGWFFWLMNRYPLLRLGLLKRQTDLTLRLLTITFLRCILTSLSPGAGS